MYRKTQVLLKCDILLCISGLRYQVVEPSYIFRELKLITSFVLNAIFLNKYPAYPAHPVIFLLANLHELSLTMINELDVGGFQ